MAFKQHSVLPGFNLALGYTLLYLSVIVLIPLAALFFKSAQMPLDAFWHTVTDPRLVASYKLTFGASLLAAVINLFGGLLLAWVLVRYPFPGKRFIDAMVDLPFALPTAVAGISLATIYAPNGWVGQLFAPWDIKIAFTRIGVVIALTFVTLPFVVRTVQPVLEDLEKKELEEAAASWAPRAAGIPQSHPAHAVARAADWFCAGVCAGHRRIRLGDFFYRGQYAVCFRNHPADDYLQAGAIRLRRRHVDCHRDVAGQLCALAGD